VCAPRTGPVLRARAASPIEYCSVNLASPTRKTAGAPFPAWLDANRPGPSTGLSFFWAIDDQLANTVFSLPHAAMRANSPITCVLRQKGFVRNASRAGMGRGMVPAPYRSETLKRPVARDQMPGQAG